MVEIFTLISVFTFTSIHSGMTESRVAKPTLSIISVMSTSFVYVEATDLGVGGSTVGVTVCARCVRI